MRLATYVPGELIPLPLSGSIPELPHVENVLFAYVIKFSGPLVRLSRCEVRDHVN